MKKFFRNLFSGYFLIIFLLLIELVFFIFFQFFFEAVVEVVLNQINESGTTDTVRWIVSGTYLLLRTLAFFFSLIIFFKIINRHEDPEFKIPWIVGMLLLPFSFSILFLLFGNHGLNKSDRIVVDATRNAYNAHFKLSKLKCIY